VPTSRPDVITYVCTQIIQLAPRRILDIGIGNGKWGFLAREYTDVWNRRTKHETIIHGVEIYSDYITSLHRSIYDKIYLGNIIDLLPRLKYYDLIIWSDVIEHLSLEDGHKVLRELKANHGVSFVTTPIKFNKQGEVFGNKHENHVSFWSAEELKVYGEVQTISKTTLLTIN
jgi:2-polyprenyl-3-methyl-5-hydroxy-6-metoxy-1,4-benzoquinol methylase